MNLLICGDSFEKCGHLWRIMGKKVLHLMRERGFGLGSRMRLAEVGGAIVEGEIVEVGADFIVVEEQTTRAAPRPRPIELVLAIPRPIMLKRIIPQVVTLGVERIVLVGTSNTEKSYTMSHVLNNDALHDLVVAGLEQAVSTFFPEIIVYEKFWRYLDEEFPDQGDLGGEIMPSNRLLAVAHTAPGQSVKKLFAECMLDKASISKVVVAVGPEGGWSEKEISALQARGFVLFNLGERVLRVETAAVSVVAQMSIIF